MASRVAQLVRDAAGGRTGGGGASVRARPGPVAGCLPRRSEEGLKLEGSREGAEPAGDLRPVGALGARPDGRRPRPHPCRRRYEGAAVSSGRSPAAEAAREWLAMRPGPLARTSDLVNRLRPVTGGRLVPAGPRSPGSRRGSPGLEARGPQRRWFSAEGPRPGQAGRGRRKARRNWSGSNWYGPCSLAKTVG